jgi:hypothetical protein
MDYFIDESEKEFFKRYHKDFEDLLLFGKPLIKENREKSNKKFARVKIGEYEQTVFVDDVTNKAYELSDNLEPGEEIEKFEFVRWARPMDI